MLPISQEGQNRRKSLTGKRLQVLGCHSITSIRARCPGAFASGVSQVTMRSVSGTFLIWTILDRAASRLASLPADCGWLDFITVRRSYAGHGFPLPFSAVWRVRIDPVSAKLATEHQMAARGRSLRRHEPFQLFEPVEHDANVSLRAAS